MAIEEMNRYHWTEGTIFLATGAVWRRMCTLQCCYYSQKHLTLNSIGLNKAKVMSYTEAIVNGKLSTKHV